jgi:hypothetical protein
VGWYIYEACHLLRLSDTCNVAACALSFCSATCGSQELLIIDGNLVEPTEPAGAYNAVSQTKAVQPSDHLGGVGRPPCVFWHADTVHAVYRKW